MQRHAIAVNCSGERKKAFIRKQADENIHRHAAVLRLAFGRGIVGHRISLGHAGRGQHAIGLPAAGLLQMVHHAGRTLFAQHLVEFLAAGGVGIADDQQQSVFHGVGLAGSVAQQRLVLFGQVVLAGGEIDVRNVLHIILVDVTETSAQSLGRGSVLLDRKLVIAETLIGRVVDHLGGLEILLLKVDLTRDEAAIPLQRLDRNGNAVQQFVRGQPVLVEAEETAARLDAGFVRDGQHRYVRR